MDLLRNAAPSFRARNPEAAAAAGRSAMVAAPLSVEVAAQQPASSIAMSGLASVSTASENTSVSATNHPNHSSLSHHLKASLKQNKNETDKFVARAERALKHASPSKGGRASSRSLSISSSRSHHSSFQQQQPRRDTGSSYQSHQSQRTSLSTTDCTAQYKQPQQKLYLGKDCAVEFAGRERELTVLREAVDKLMSTSSSSKNRSKHDNLKHNPQPQVMSSHEEDTIIREQQAPPTPRVICISGPPGSGKSRLAQQIKSQVMERDGYFITGKMDQQTSSNNNNVVGGQHQHHKHETQAYAGLATAIHQLAEQILARDFDMGIRRRLQETIVGAEAAKVLVEVFPAFETILQTDDDDDDIDDDEYHDYNSGQKNVPTTPISMPIINQRPLSASSLKRSDSNPATMKSHRRRFLFQQFIRVLLTPHECYQDEDITLEEAETDPEEEPATLVLVLEDLQWIDTPSLDLISSLVRDRGLEKFLLVTTSRPLDEQPEHPFVKQKEIWAAQQIPIESLELENLNAGDINTILSSLLDNNTSDDDDMESTVELAELVHQKTSGNAFFAIEFIKALVDQDLLTYSFGDMRWKYDIERVQSLVLDGDDTAVGLLTSKLKRLPLQKQLVLVVAAFLGITFREELLSNLIDHLDGEEILGENFQGREETEAIASASDKTNDVDLLSFEELGFLGRSRDVYFFAHDLIQQAAIDLVSGDKSLLLKQRIGEFILQGTKYGKTTTIKEGRGDDMLFLGVDLCNITASSLGRQHHPMKMHKSDLADFNLRAGEKAMQESAFALSLRYTQTGLHLLEDLDVAFERESQLQLSLLACAADASFGAGRMEYMEFHVDQILKLPKCPDELMFRMLNLKILSTTLREQLRESFEIGWNAMVYLGVAKFPKKPSMLYVIKELIKTKRLLRGHTRESLLALPLMEDENRVTALQFFDAVIPCCYIANPNFFLITQLKSIRWAVKYGVSKYTPASFAILGMVLLNVLGEVQTGVLYGEVALALSERLGDKGIIAKASMMTFTWIHHWTNDMRTCRQPILYSHRLAMEMGDSLTGLLCLYNVDCITWCSSFSPLNVLAHDLERHFNLCCEYQSYVTSDIMVAFAKGLRRLCSNNCSAFHWLDAPVVTPPSKKEHDPMIQYFHDIMLLQSHLLLGEILEALKCAEATFDVAKVCLGQPYVPRALFYRALVFLSLASDGQNVRHNIREAKQIYAALKKKFADKGNINCVHMVILLEAELAKLKKDYATARQRYTDAITLATRSGHIHDAGISNECAGKFFIANKDPSRASFHMEQAIKCFLDWGAGAVAQRLKDKHATLISSYSVAFRAG